MFISHVEILGVETCSQILETGEDDIVQTGTFLYVFIVLVLEVRGSHFLVHSQLVDYLTKPLFIKSKPSKKKGMLTITRSELLTKSFGQNMFARFLIFLWLVRIQKSVISISRGILNET